MIAIKKRAARKAAKMTARHAAHGAASKVRRAPFRSGGLLAAGAAVGAAAAWLTTRVTSRRGASTGA